MPETLISATADFRNGTIDEETWHARIEERRRYAIRPRSRPDEGGHVRMHCPAAGPNPTARCVLKPASEGESKTTRTRIPVTGALAAFPPKICTQQSVTLPPEAGAKFAQAMPHGTEEWRAHYATLRSANEGMNGFVKDGANEALDDPERRRIRGVAAQSVLVAFQFFAANLRKIGQFLVKKFTEAKKLRTLLARRRTRSLADFAPAGKGDTVSTSGDPDPPLGA
jgi:hypothetical protein